MARPSTSSESCYRHPEKESYVLCQRCGNTICGQCQVPAAVGSHCPDCAAARAPRAAGLVKRGSPSGYRPVATYSLLGILVAVFVAQLLSGGWVTERLLYWPPLTAIEPWRMVTAVFVHSTSSFFHLLFNGFSLYVLGTLVEKLVGRGRFVTLFLLAGFGGSVAVLWLAPASAVVGASGAVFGLFGALFVIQRSFGGANVQLLIVLALNLVMGFIVPGISWQAHIGGLIVGALAAWIMVATRAASQRTAQKALLVAVAGGLIAISALRMVI
jgi:membrane associated rhomboid family serine protease